MSIFRGLARDSFLSALVHIAPRLANAGLFIIIGRLYGPDPAGLFALATTFLIITTTIPRGMDDLVIRQVAQEPQKAGDYLLSFGTFRLGLAALLLGLILALVHLIDYPGSTRMIILVISLSLLPDSLAAVGQAILLGQQRFIPPAAGMLLATGFKLVAGGLAASQHNLLQVAWYWTGGSLIGMLIILAIALRSVGGWPTGIDWDVLRNNWRRSWTFISLTGLATLEGQTDIILLSALRSPAEVGWYNAATTIVYSLAIISQAFRLSIYPLMARYVLAAPEQLRRLYQQSLRYLAVLSLPMAAGIFVLADPIVHLIYKEAFQPTVVITRILIPVVVLLFVNVPSARIMLVNDRQQWSARILTLSAGLNILLNLLLDPTMGARGAAIARLSSSTVLFVLTFLYANRYLVQVDLAKILLRPSVATLIMGLSVWCLRQQPLLYSIPAGALVYLATLWLIGGLPAEDLALLRKNFIPRQRLERGDKEE